MSKVRPMAPSGFRAIARAGGLALTLLPAGEPWAAGSEDFLTRYSLTRGFRSGQPTAIAIPRLGAAPGKGRTGPGDVLFLRSGPRDRVQSLWSFDPNTGAERELLTSARLLGGADETLSPEEKARRERLRLTARGLSSFQISNDGRFVLVPLSGRVFLMERATGVARELAKGVDAPADDARCSPGRARLARLRR